MLHLLQAYSCNDGVEDELPCSCLCWKYSACWTHTLRHTPSKPGWPVLLVTVVSFVSPIFATLLAMLLQQIRSALVGIKSWQLHSCLLELKAFCMRRPNDNASFSSDRGVYVNNASMVHDRLHCICCHGDFWTLTLLLPTRQVYSVGNK